jgi:hypothetical protein
MRFLRSCLLAGVVSCLAQIPNAVAQTPPPPIFPKPTQAEYEACRRCMLSGPVPNSGTDAMLAGGWATLGTMAAAAAGKSPGLRGAIAAETAAAIEVSKRIRDEIGKNLACRSTGCAALERYTYAVDNYAKLYAQFGAEAQKRLSENVSCTINYLSDTPGMPKDYGKNTKKCSANFPLHQTWSSTGCNNIECGSGSGTACLSDKKCPIK